MKSIITCCVYCERSPEEVLEEPTLRQVMQLETDAVLPKPTEILQFVSIGSTRVLLCPFCRGERPIITPAEDYALLNAPIEFPPNILSVEHSCSMRLFDGFSEEESTMIVSLEEGVLDGYRVGRCAECGMSVCSPILPINENGDSPT